MYGLLNIHSKIKTIEIEDLFIVSFQTNLFGTVAKKSELSQENCKIISFFLSSFSCH